MQGTPRLVENMLFILAHTYILAHARQHAPHHEKCAWQHANPGGPSSMHGWQARCHIISSCMEDDPYELST